MLGRVDVSPSLHPSAVQAALRDPRRAAHRSGSREREGDHDGSGFMLLLRRAVTSELITSGLL